MPTATLSIRHLSVRFGDRWVLDQLNFQAMPGEITALLGVNGAGKTTMVRSVVGLVRYEGEVLLGGAVPGSRQASTLLGVMPQETGAWSGVRVGELLRYLAGLYAEPLPVPALMQWLQIDDIAQHTYRRLSGGQRQLVNLAGALVGRCPIVILDEPTAGMDPHVRRRTWDVLTQLRDAGVTVVLTTHDMVEVDALASSVSILHGGAIAYQGDREALALAGGADAVFMEVTS